MKSKNNLLAFGTAVYIASLLAAWQFGLPPKESNLILTVCFVLFLWLSETIPIAVASLLPLVLFPLLGIQTFGATAENYSRPIILLFLGGFLLGMGFEKSGLHKRFALLVLNRFGTSPAKILGSFMLSTAVLSMWISNTAATMIMLPICISTLSILSKSGQNTGRLTISLLLGVAYAANIGGTATIIGTPPNAILIGFLETMAGISIDFLTWMLFALPLTCLLLFVTWLVFAKFLFKEKDMDLKKLRAHYKESLGLLGKLRSKERRVLMIFGATVLLWLIRRPILEVYLGKGLLTDHSIALLGAILMFVVPAGKSQKILVWEDTKQLPWGILLFFGGALAISDGLESSGILDSLAPTFGVLAKSNVVLFALIGTASIIFLTEFLGNAALCTVFIPLVIGMMGPDNPDLLPIIVVMTLGSSCSFMFPMATPPNAIVFSTGKIGMGQMMKMGIYINLVSLMVLFGVGYWLARLVF